MREPPLPPNLLVPPADGGVVAAVSGGRDSMALALLLRAAGIQPLHLAFVEHGYRPGAAAAERRAALALAEHVHAPLHVLAVPPDASFRVGNAIPEAKARAARYQALFDCARRLGIPCVATGHHAEDQAETRLLQLLRGGELHALIGMQERRRFAGLWLWRPLLRTEPADLLNWTEPSGLQHCEDASNRDLRMRRNLVRHALLPRLRGARDPWISRQQPLGTLALAALQRVRRRWQVYLEEHAESTLRRDHLLLRRELVQRFSAPFLHHFFSAARRYLRPTEVAPTLSRRHSEALGRWLLAANAGGEQRVAGLRFQRSGRWLSVLASDRPVDGAERCLALGETWGHPDGTWSVCLRAGPPEESAGAGVPVGPEPWIVRTARPGDELRIGPWRRRLKRLFLDHQIPRAERAVWPVLCRPGSGQEVHCVPGLSPPPAIDNPSAVLAFRGLPGTRRDAGRPLHSPPHS